MEDFDYLSEKDIYLDSACQSLRPRPVLAALEQYYNEYSSCGERVKYKWGQRTDSQVLATRQKVLKYLKLKSRDYFVSFTLNTTYGINLLLNQLDPEKAGLKQVVTSDIEHNSPFLATMTFAKTHNLPRLVLTREPDGCLPVEEIPDHSLLVVNTCSNVDGRLLPNLKEVIKYVHKTGGLVIFDAAQAMAHHSEMFYKTEPDAICFSAHKMYAPSLGGMVVRKDLLKYVKTSFIGGGMVDDVDRESFQLSVDNPEHIYTIFEPGLQAWGEIIALGAAIDWLAARPKSDKQNLAQNTENLYTFLENHPKVHLINSASSSVMSFYLDGLDSHLLGGALAEEGIMARTGYFCAHYYLDHVKHYPPLVRFSLGYHNRPGDIEKVTEVLSRLR